MEQPPEQATEQRAELSAGTVIADRYVVEECIGMGSRSAVYLCSIQGAPDSRVAVKLMLPQLSDQDRAKFRKEVRASVSVNNPNVIRCLEQFSENGIDGFAMEFAEGGTLKELIAEDAPVPLTRALGLAADMCAGLHALHEIGIVHRDLKLRNLFLSSEDSLLIGDFGLCLLPGEQGVVEPGNVIGAIEYVSPEYVQTGKIDRRADIYAVGLLLYQLLSGKYPFERSQQPVESLMKRLTGNPIPLEELQVSCPRRVSQAIYRALERDPQKRFQSAAEMEQELRACISSFADDAPERSRPTLAGGLFDSEQEESHAPRNGLFDSHEEFGHSSLTAAPRDTNVPPKSTKILEAPTPVPPPEMTIPPFDASYPNDGDLSWEDDRLHRKQLAVKILVGVFVLLLAFGLILSFVPGDEISAPADSPEETLPADVKAEPESARKAPIVPAKPERKAFVPEQPEEIEAEPLEEAAPAAESAEAEVVEPSASDLNLIIGDEEPNLVEDEVTAVEAPNAEPIEPSENKEVREPAPRKLPSAPKPITFSKRK